MKRSLFLAFTIISLFVCGLVRLQPSQAQVRKMRSSLPSVSDPEMAEVVKALTDHSSDELEYRQMANGEVKFDVDGRFQGVPLAKFEADGEAAVACATSLGEANDFFGRNLETGEIYEKPLDVELPTTTSNLDITPEEYQFYSELIAKANSQSLSGPLGTTITVDTAADGATEGFNDPTVKGPEGGNAGATLGAQRQNLFTFAAGIWSAYLDSSVPVKVSAKFDSISPCSSTGGVLGSAGAATFYRDFTNAVPGTWYPVALANKISGIDRNGTTAEINAQFNSDVDSGCLGSGSRFYYGLDNTTPPNTVNLLVVLLHEMGHGLGFLSLANGADGSMPQGFPDTYSKQLFDKTTGLYWPQMTAAQRQASALNTSNLLWDGASVKSASSFMTGGRDTANGRVQMYTPTAYQQGS